MLDTREARGPTTGQKSQEPPEAHAAILHSVLLKPPVKVEGHNCRPSHVISAALEKHSASSGSRAENTWKAFRKRRPRRENVGTVSGLGMEKNV